MKKNLVLLATTLSIAGWSPLSHATVKTELPPLAKPMAAGPSKDLRAAMEALRKHTPKEKTGDRKRVILDLRKLDFDTLDEAPASGAEPKLQDARAQAVKDVLQKMRAQVTQIQETLGAAPTPATVEQAKPMLYSLIEALSKLAQRLKISGSNASMNMLFRADAAEFPVVTEIRELVRDTLAFALKDVPAAPGAATAEVTYVLSPEFFSIRPPALPGQRAGAKPIKLGDDGLQVLPVRDDLSIAFRMFGKEDRRQYAKILKWDPVRKKLLLAAEKVTEPTAESEAEAE